jgi:hypothetical protein
MKWLLWILVALILFAILAGVLYYTGTWTTYNPLSLVVPLGTPTTGATAS